MLGLRRLIRLVLEHRRSAEETALVVVEILETRQDLLVRHSSLLRFCILVMVRFGGLRRVDRYSLPWLTVVVIGPGVETKRCYDLRVSSFVL